MNDAALTALATAMLVIVGFAQVFVLIAQKRQTRIALINEYRQLWNNYRPQWGTVIFISRRSGEYYQVIDKKRIDELIDQTEQHINSQPTIWARESAQKVFGFLGEISSRLLQGHLAISDLYPVLGTEFLRHSRPLRQLLDASFQSEQVNHSEKHELIKSELQE